VARAVPDVSFPAAVVRGGTPLTTDSQSTDSQGHGWDSAVLAPYRLWNGAQPRSGEVVLDAATAARSGAEVGDRIPLLVRGEIETFRFSGIAATPRTTTRPALFFSASDAARLAGHSGTVDDIGVLPRPGIDVTALAHKVNGAVGGHGAVTLTGPDRGVAEFPGVRASAGDLIVLAAVFGGMAAAVTLFVVASTLSLAARHRQRELALLRTIGTTPRQVRRMILGEAMVVAVLAAAASIAPSVLFGRWLYGRLTAHGVVPDVVTHYQGRVPLLAGLGAALVTTLGAAIVAGRRAAKARPVEALVEAGIQRHWLGPIRLLLALLFLGGGLALGLVTATVLHGPIAASTAGPSVLCWAIGLALLGPGITRVAMGVLRWPARAVTGLGGMLAVQNLRARAIPMAAAVMPLMLATGIATSNLYLQTTQVHEADKAYTADLRADAVLTSSTGGVSPRLLDRVRQAPGVAGAGAFVSSTGLVDAPHAPQDEDGTPLQGVTGPTAEQTLAVPVTSGRLADLTGNTVALPVTEARKLHRGVGGTITMRLGDRSAVRLRVVALFTAKTGYETILLPAELLAAHTTDGLPSQILVKAAPGVSTARLTATLSGVAAGWPGVRVADRGALIRQHDEGQQIQAWINYLMIGMIVAYTVIAVANTLIASTGRRRREFGLQRLTGATRALVLRMAGLEGALVAVAGIALGTVVSILTLVPFCMTIRDSPFPAGPLWIYLAVMGAAGALTLVTTVAPAWLALRSRPAEAALAAE
jgi:putative ABC transport system permease protein